MRPKLQSLIRGECYWARVSRRRTGRVVGGGDGACNPEKMLKHVVSTLSAILLFATASQAATVGVTKANGDFIAGTGISATGFTLDTNSVTGDSVALKARNYGTDEYGLSGNHYFVNAGTSPLDADRYNLQFDFQFTPGDVLPEFYYLGYALAISFDQDPTSGVDYQTVEAPLLGWAFTDGFKDNPASTDTDDGAWSNDETPFVYSQSWQPQWTGADFNGEPGDYNIKFEAMFGSNVIASTEIVATVVPVPSPTAALGGMALLGMTVLRRRSA